VADRRGSNVPANPHFPAEKLTQTKASQLDSSSRVNQGFQDEKENENDQRVFQPLQSGVHDPKLGPHPPGYARLSIIQSGIKRPVAAAALPDHAAFVEHADERTCLVAVADFQGAKLTEPAPQVRM
jgi:hypothetical protein